MAQLDFLNSLDTAFTNVASTDEAFTVTCRFAWQLGFEHVIHAPVRNHLEASKNWAATSYPAKWQQLYVEKGYLSRNPVRQQAAISSVPFLWSGLEKSLKKPEREIFVDCRECGMQDGYVVPVHGAWGQAVAIGFACQSLEAIRNPGKSALQLLAYKLHHLFDLAVADTHIRITQREKQVLILLAQGAHTTTIGNKLMIADNSVEWHLKNIYRKLQVNNRTAAVVKAIQLGLLEL